MSRGADDAFVRWVLRLAAVPFVGLGLAFLLVPATMSPYVELGLDGPTADADVRAVYGGLQLGCGALLLVASSRPETQRIGVLALLCLYGGLAGARFVAYAVAGLPSTLGLALHAGELAGLALGAVAWLRLSD